MNVLWITNIVFPEAEQLLTGSEDDLKASGGWMIGAAEELTRQPNVKLIVATICRDVKDLVVLKGKVIDYYLIPYGRGNTRYNQQYEQYWIRVKDAVNPDVVHIHGTGIVSGELYRLAKSAGVTLKTVWICIATALAVWLMHISPVYVVLLAVLCGVLLSKKERAK